MSLNSQAQHPFKLEVTDSETGEVHTFTGELSEYIAEGVYEDTAPDPWGYQPVTLDRPRLSYIQHSFKTTSVYIHSIKEPADG